MISVEVMGRLGRDPEMRFTPTGEPVVNFSVCTDSKYKDNAGIEHKKLWWFRATAWGKSAESINQYFHKGDGIWIRGELIPDEHGNPRTFTRQDGTVGSSYEVRVLNWTFPPGKSGDNTQVESAPEEPENDDIDDGAKEIPFNQ